MEDVYYIDLVHDVVFGRHKDSVFKMKNVNDPVLPAGKYNMVTCKDSKVLRSNYDIDIAKILKFKLCGHNQLLKITFTGTDLKLECF